MRSDYTHLTIVLDRSGSMASIKNDIIGGFNGYLAEQTKVAGKVTVTLVQFDELYEVVYSGVEAKDCAPRTAENYQPRGSTALIDAACRAIDETGTFLAGLPESERPARVACVILTDGQENASHEQKKADLVRRIETQAKDFHWAFAYIGSDPSTFAEAGGFHVMAASTMNYQHTPAGVAACMDSLSRGTANYTSGLTGNQLKVAP